MQAITCKYLPATNCKGSRIKATCEAGSVTVGYHSGSDDPYRDAAEELCKKLDWNGALIRGSLPNGVVVWVFEHGERMTVC